MDYGVEFDPSKVSKRMGGLTSTVLGWRMTINPHRHVNVSYKRHKCKGLVDARVEEDVLSEVFALQAGHSSETERRIYGLDHANVAGVSEDTINLFLEASKVFQNAFGIPPGGRGLPYNKTRMSDFVARPRPKPGSASDGNLATILDAIKVMEAANCETQKALLDTITDLQAQLSSLKGDPASVHSPFQS